MKLYRFGRVAPSQFIKDPNFLGLGEVMFVSNTEAAALAWGMIIAEDFPDVPSEIWEVEAPRALCSRQKEFPIGECELVEVYSADSLAVWFGCDYGDSIIPMAEGVVFVEELTSKKRIW